MNHQLYQKLLTCEPLGFIDPFTDLGEFDGVRLTFTEPVGQLVNKYSGKPYNAYWQKRIEEMRELYIEYREDFSQSDEPLDYRLRNKKARESADEIVTTYLKLGFRFKEIEDKARLPIKRLRRNWRRSDHVEMVKPCFFLKSSLAEGDDHPQSTLPSSLTLSNDEEL
ncbi:modification methylase Sau96I [Streptococcus suis]|uniref:modification methylase Sau96I n=1 Tax=Streptococcus suis TaxID=1307 RepID=UPI000C17E41C|nr:modification methylase Sau96I [Streptococcus suis]WNO82646.1 modification methylase Sau96I [Streptococcus suis]HEL1619362.1 modification methylase Sau96I [Streptococcus suis]HEL2277695.1 modification methylase Sau96I [Streptococcus suis]HEM6147019.1 modification methylase Sau96I [Streptococcus suis]HEM6363921.1 modification methylase Sau96I [Streptococcus suis]